MKKFIVLDKEFEIQKTFNDKADAERYAKENSILQPQILASITILKKYNKR